MFEFNSYLTKSIKIIYSNSTTGSTKIINKSDVDFWVPRIINSPNNKFTADNLFIWASKEVDSQELGAFISFLELLKIYFWPAAVSKKIKKIRPEGANAPSGRIF